MKHIAWLFLFSLLSFPYTAEDIALRTETKLRSLRSIQAKFEQVYYSSTVSTPLREKGNFYFKKPGLMKWEYKDPEERTYLFKEGFILEYIPEDNQIIKYDLSREEHESEILSILSGQKGIVDNYSVEFNLFPTKNSKALQLKLTPKQEDTDTFILLEIDEKTWLIQKAIFFDWAGNKMEYSFSKIKTNVRFAKDVFELKVPPGVEIIENQTN